MKPRGQPPLSYEDYLEALLRAERRQDVARGVDLAAALGVHKSTVTATLKALAARGLVTHARYAAARLTPDGAVVAARTAARHTLIRDYLARMLLLEDEAADRNACRLEHVLDAPAVARLEAAARFAAARPRVTAAWRRAFGAFVASGGGRARRAAARRGGAG